MKRWVGYVLAVIAVAALDGAAAVGDDVAKLDPVQVLYVDVQGQWVSVQTDTGAEGRGKDVDGALRDMEKTSAAEVFLDTTEYLIVSPEAQGNVGALWEVLRPSCQVCVGVGELDLERAADHLDIHRPGVTMKAVRSGERDLPQLVAKEGRMELVP